MKTRKLKFGIDKSALTSINIQPDRGKEIMHELFYSANLFNKINFLTGIKSGDLIPIMNFAPSFVAGGCGYTDGNNLTLSDKAIVTKLLKSDVTLCAVTVAGTSFEVYIPNGTNAEEFTSQELIEMYMQQRYAKAMQAMALTGTTGANSIDGLITLAYASPNVVQVTGTAPTTTDALDKIFAVYESMDGESLSSDANPIIICGTDWLRKASIQSYNDNRSTYNFQIDEENGFTLPTTNVRVQGYEELNGTNKLLAGSARYMVVGTDLEDSMNEFKSWWSEDNQELRTRIQFRLGAALLFESKLRRYTVQP